MPKSWPVPFKSCSVLHKASKLLKGTCSAFSAFALPAYWTVPSEPALCNQRPTAADSHSFIQAVHNLWASEANVEGHMIQQHCKCHQTHAHGRGGTLTEISWVPRCWVQNSRVQNWISDFAFRNGKHFSQVECAWTVIYAVASYGTFVFIVNIIYI